MRWIEKWSQPTFFDGPDELYITMQSLGEIEQHTPAVGAKIWCLYVFFFFLSVMLVGRRAFHSKGTYFEYVMCRCLWVDFDSFFTFFQKWLPFQNR